MKKPEQLSKIDLDALKENCQGYVDLVGGYADADEEIDYKQYIFETAMEAVFGEDIWDFINHE